MRKCHTFYKSINHKVFRVCFLLYVHILYVTHDSQKFWKGWLSFKMADCLSKWQTCFAKTLDPKRLRKFTVYFRIDCCSLWIDPIIQNIKHIPKKSTAKSQFYNDWCPYCRVCLYDWSHVIQKDVQLISPPWLDGDASPKKRQEPPTTSAFRKAYIPWVLGTAPWWKLQRCYGGFIVGNGWNTKIMP